MSELQLIIFVQCIHIFNVGKIKKNAKRLEGAGFVYFHPSFYISLLLLLREDITHVSSIIRIVENHYLQASTIALASPRE